MKVFVTGATDLIGSYVAVRLAQEGHDVVAASTSLKKAPSLGKVPGITRAKFDMASSKNWPHILEGCEVLIHISHGWGTTGSDMLEADTLASVALFEAARKAGVQQIIYTSSTLANGELDVLNDETRQSRPFDFFGASKAATEVFARAYALNGGPRIQVVRPGYVFGEPIVRGTDAESDQRFIHICQAVNSGTPIRLIRNDGTQFLHARDIAEVYLALLGHAETFSIHYALASEWISWARIAEMAMAEAGKTVPLELDDLGWGQLPYLFDVRKIDKDFELSFGNEPQLREHIRWALALP